MTMFESFSTTWNNCLAKRLTASKGIAGTTWFIVWKVYSIDGMGSLARK